MLRERANERRCPFHSIADPWPIDPRTLKKCADLCRELGVVIWHGHDYKSNLFGVLLRKRCNLRLFTTVHGWVKYTSRTPLYFAVDRWSIKRYEEVVCVSQDLYDECARFGVPKEKLALIENAIDTEEFRRAGAVERAVAGGGRECQHGRGRKRERIGSGLDHDLVVSSERDLEPVERAEPDAARSARRRRGRPLVRGKGLPPPDRRGRALRRARARPRALDRG
ncbi:MAG: glycosyltransferase [Planctomycetes bacterium]|nr:glycosyltransferase [Planctomycetota bacterium]